MALLALVLAGGGAASASAHDGKAPALTPLLLHQDGPGLRPFEGADGRFHLLYSVELTNATTVDLRVSKVEVLAGNRRIHTFGPKASATMVETLGSRKASAKIGASQSATLFVTLSFSDRARIPAKLSHRVTVRAPAFGGPQVTAGAETKVMKSAPVPVLGPPLEPGDGYLAADTCCESTRHIRAALPLDNRLWFGQRFAVDWEQVDQNHRIVNGDPKQLANYVIYGKRAIAVADGTVVATIDGLPANPPGTLPGVALGLDEVDGNHVVLAIGHGLFAMYAHLQAGSITVEPGDWVRKGQVLGLVGSSGNSLAPHLHFQVNDRRSPLAANGVPFLIDRFSSTLQGRSTAAFDRAEAGRGPLPVEPAAGRATHHDQMPLDLSLVSFR